MWTFCSNFERIRLDSTYSKRERDPLLNITRIINEFCPHKHGKSSEFRAQGLSNFNTPKVEMGRCKKNNKKSSHIVSLRDDESCLPHEVCVYVCVR